MHVKCAVLTVLFVCFPHLSLAWWMSQVTSPEGLLLGEGLTLRLLDLNNNQNSSDFMERQAVRVDYGDYGVSMKKKGTAVEMGLVEGRGEKGQSLMTVILGYKLATIVTIILTGLGALVFKALGLAKLAIVSSLIMLIVKLFHQQKEPEFYELDHHAEAQNYVEQYAPADAAYHPSASANSNNFFAYSNNYTPMLTGAANYNVDPSVGNSTTALAQSLTGVSGFIKRRDSSKRKNKPPLLTIHRYTVNS